MLGDQALKLVQECRATEASGDLKPYNDELVRLVLLETRQLQSHVGELLEQHGAEAAESDRALAAQLVTHHLAAQRNKRCLLAYHHHRLEWLRSRLWEKGGNLALLLEDESRSSSSAQPSANVLTGKGSTSLRSRMSPNELGWLKAYSELITGYKTEFLDVLDIAGPLSRSGVTARGLAARTIEGMLDVAPPTELMVTVVATRDARDVQTERGSLNLRSGERMRVARSEVEGLILRGWLAVVDD